MAKSRCEQQLEDVTRERDYWRDKARDLADQVAELQAAQEVFSAFSAGGLKEVTTRYDRMKQDLTTERDTVRGERDYLLNLIALKLQFIRDRISSYDDRWPEIRKMIEVLEEKRGGTPQLARLLNAIAQDVEQIYGKSYNKYVPKRIDEHGGAYTVPQDPTLALTEIEALSTIDAALMMRVKLVITAYGLSHPPQLIADELLRDCRVFGKPQPQTLQRVNMAWVAELPDAPSKLTTLSDGLAWHTQVIKSGMTDQVFWEQNPDAKSVRHLRRYRRWVEALEDMARQHVEIQELLEQEP